MRRAIRTIVVCVAALAALPASVEASTVGVSGGDALFYNAGPGESNNVTISRQGSDYVITDPPAAISVNPPCSVPVPGEVHCPVSGIDAIDVEVFDLNDRATIAASVVDLAGTFGFPVTIEGGGGNDILSGAPNVANALYGDTPVAGTGSDQLNGGSQDDLLFGAGGGDALAGNDGHDTLFDGEGNDSASGGRGFDSFDGGSAPNGADTFSGGPDGDSLGYDSRSGAVSVTPDGVANDGASGEADNVAADIERLRGGEGNDSLTGSDVPNSIFTGAGNDSADGGGGRDTLFGDRGEDSIRGGPGPDELFGGPGIDDVGGDAGDDSLFSSESDDDPDALAGGPGTDLVDYSDAGGAVSVSLDGTADDGVAGEQDNVLPDVEDVVGSDRGDTLVGNASANVLEGGSGDDSLSGLGGPDGLEAGRGADFLDGGLDRDLLAGGSEIDLLRTRDGGPDEASCGAGADDVLADGADDPRADCEGISRGVAIAGGRIRVSRNGSFRLKLACPAAESVDCAGRVRLVSAKKLAAGKRGKRGKRRQATGERRRATGKRRLTLAAAKIDVEAGETQTVKLDLKRSAEKVIGQRPRLPARASATFTDIAGEKVTTERRVVLNR